MKKILLALLLVSGASQAYTLHCDEGRTATFRLLNGAVAFSAGGKTITLPAEEMNDYIALYRGQANDGSGGMFIMQKGQGIHTSIYIRGTGNTYHCSKSIPK